MSLLSPPDIITLASSAPPVVSRDFISLSSFFFLFFFMAFLARLYSSPQLSSPLHMRPHPNATSRSDRLAAGKTIN